MKLREYQNTISNQAVEKLHNFGCCYLSMECRTGKTITALVTAARFGAKSVLFVTKLKAIGSIESDYKLLHPCYSIQVVNYESAHKAEGDFDLIILDEAHSLGAYPKPSKRAETPKAIRNCTISSTFASTHHSRISRHSTNGLRLASFTSSRRN